MSKKMKKFRERAWEFNPITGELIPESSNLYLVCKCGSIIKDLNKEFKDSDENTPKNKVCSIIIICPRCNCEHRFFGLTATQLEKFRTSNKND